MSNCEKVLITGGGGMLAQALARSLRARGTEPTVLTRVDLDITDVLQVEQAFKQFQPTIAINCAAYTKVDQAEREPEDARRCNALGPALLVSVGERYKTVLVHFSTDYVFDGTLRRPLLPGDPVGPKSVYGETKLRGERVIAESTRPNWLILRTAWLYGPGGPNFVQTMLNAARAGKKLSVIDDQTGSPTFTHDLAEATLDMIDRGARGVHHITNSGQTSWFEFARAIFDEFELTPDLSPMKSAAWKIAHPQTAMRPEFSVLDCTATEQIIGRPLPDWRGALHRYRLEMGA